jgi:hypothetical protein
MHSIAPELITSPHRVLRSEKMAEPKPAQEEAVASLRAIEHEWVTGDEYHATPEELEAIDEADCSEVATDKEVEAAFRFFGAP